MASDSTTNSNSTGSSSGGTRTLTGSLNRGLNPLNLPDYLRSYRSDDPDQPDAGEIRDPHQWDDPEQTRRERFTPDSTARWILLISLGIISIGLVWYFYPILSPAYQSPYALGGFVAIGVALLIYTKGREDGMDAYRELDKWVDYDGNRIEVRPGEHTGWAGTWALFETIRRVTYGGFNKRKLRKRDLPYDAEKLKKNDRDTGEDPAVDALNPTVKTAECDHLGKFLFTHSNGLDYCDGMASADRETTLPRTLDEDDFDEFLRLVNELQHQVQKLEDDKEMLRDRNDDVTNLRDELNSPQIEQTLTLLQQMQSLISRRRAPVENGSSVDSGGPSTDTDFDFGTSTSTNGTRGES